MPIAELSSTGTQKPGEPMRSQHWAVAAAALIAAQCPGGGPISTSYGPDEALPILAIDLRPLAVEALDRVVAENCELAGLWDETADGPERRQAIGRIRAVLAPEPEPREPPLFDL
ncbi:DUF4259 domain-containing protein [Kitasatospora sp. NPDC056446]|uniref:DUF4259 domain-containing protein n=1 Tax=Kitasatospora sp. NPDC056446 TaxID=3345819 RepID=UPI0036BF7650